MRCNADTVLVTPQLRLVPYRPEHVPTYHGWMQDAELLRLTASERLDAAEEAANQASWTADDTKGTFIILEGGREGELRAGGAAYGGGCSSGQPPPFLTAEIEVMVAELSARRRGFATAAVQAAMAYAASVVGVRVFVAKVLANNVASLVLFRRLGFGNERVVAAFDEVHLTRRVGEEGEPLPPLPPILSYDAEVARWRAMGGGVDG
ncbi:hypothetical protein MMPV_004747 [Pyropia vietnamensis]